MTHSAQTSNPSEVARYNDALDTGLLSSECEQRFERFVRFLAQAVDAACAIMFISDLTRHHFVAREGVSQKSTSREGSVLTHLLYCESDQVSAVNKLSAEKFWHATSTTDSANAMQSLLSMPLQGPKGHIIGGIVIMDTKPRKFTQSDIELLTSIAGLIQTEVNLHSEEYAIQQATDLAAQVHKPARRRVLSRSDIVIAELESARLNNQHSILIECELVAITTADLEREVLDFLQQERIAAIESVIECTIAPIEEHPGCFTVMVNDPSCDASIAMQRIKKVANGISSYHMKPIASKVYCGVAIYPDDGFTSDCLTEVANLALARAKKPWNQDIQFGSSNSQKNYRRLHLMEAQLGSAVPGVDLQTIFQPIIDAHDGQLLGVEASCQWQTKDFGIVQPADFLAITTNPSLVRKVVDCVIESAIRQGAVWQRMSGRSLLVSLAVSPEMMNVAGMANRVHQQMQAECLADGSVLLVLQLNDLKELCPRTAETIHDFQSLGIQVAVNYNNTEYSALRQLKSLTVSAVKLQRHFLESITIGQPVHSITKVVMDIADHLGLQVMIEDVQNEQELKAVRELGCRAVQGDFISPAVSGEEISSFLTEGVPLLGNTA